MFTIYINTPIDLFLDMVEGLSDLVPNWVCPVCGSTFRGDTLVKEDKGESLVLITITHTDPTHSPCQIWYDHGEYYPA